MISATAWIRKGAAAATPARFQMTEEQYAEIMQRAKFEIDDAKEALLAAQEQRAAAKTTQSKDRVFEDVEEDLAKFNLEAYSDGEENGLGDKDAVLDAISAVDDAALGKDDPYLQPANGAQDESDEDLDDLRLRPTDNLVVACRTEDEVSHLEVYVYEEEDANLYVHHDVMLPSFPLCVEWVGAPLSRNGQASHGNFAAIGTFEPEIELWDLDVLEVPYPTVILGQRKVASDTHKSRKGGSAKKPSSKKPSGANAEMHTAAVMSLSWNKLNQNLLLSGSADATVKLWDLGRAVALRSFEHHTDKVQALQWNPAEASLLASAAYDRRAMFFDCRLPDEIHSWTLPADPECLKWNPHDTHCFAVTDEEGRVLYFDSRKGANSEPVFTLAAHAKPVTALDWNASLPNCMLTVSADKTIKLWNIRGGQLTCVASRDVGIGKAFAGSFSPDTPNLVCVAGSRGVLSVINLFRDAAVLEGFQNQDTK